MMENTFSHKYWEERAAKGGIDKKSCTYMAHLDRRAPYNNIAATTRRIKLYPKADRNWKKKLGDYPNMPSEARAEKFYKDWAA